MAERPAVRRGARQRARVRLHARPAGRGRPAAPRERPAAARGGRAGRQRPRAGRPGRRGGARRARRAGVHRPRGGAAALPKHREVVELTFDEDLSDAQIADRLGVPVGTVRSRTYYALRALRLDLEERGLVG
ncbi:hypothetical protein GKE82_15620 [Conexibacter sp. W3-3-2]|nr:hypothetical protein [Conexibacter sp. W3-3-2]